MPDDSVPSMQSHRADQPNFLTQKRFDELDLPDPVLAGLKDAGFTHCTPIQAQTLPVSLTGRDVAGQAQTGTGKTAAFLVTVITRLLAASNRKPELPSALIIAPTRELSRQIFEEAEVLCRHTELTLAQVVGGIDYQKQARILKNGVDIIICTPGRVIDYYKQGIFKTGNIKVLVIDEADRLLDLGFAKDMQYLLRKLPAYTKRQSMLFSATLSYRVMELTYEFMNLPEFIAIAPEEVTVEGIEQELYHVGIDKKLSLLLGFLEREDWTRMLIFVNTKVGVDWLTQKLQGNQWPADRITGDLPQRQRFRLMENFKKGKIKILVATDVASRGIHVEDISHVINYDIPQDAENYVHRIGRTARAGKTGRAISLACEDYVYHLEPLEDMLGYKIPVAWPEDDWYVEDKSAPIRPMRRKQLRRSALRSGRDRANKGRPSKKTPAKSKPRTFPGAFFGFGPSPEEAEKPTTSEKAASQPRKRKRRSSRKSQRPAKNTKAPQTDSKTDLS